MSEPEVFILAKNYNTLTTLKDWIYTPAVFFTLFIWILATIVSVKNRDNGPFKWTMILTIILILFKLVPMSLHPAGQVLSPIGTKNEEETLPSVSPSPTATVAAAKTIPKETPSAQLITN
jgi:hypothetical protein